MATRLARTSVRIPDTVRDFTCDLSVIASVIAVLPRVLFNGLVAPSLRAPQFVRGFVVLARAPAVRVGHQVDLRGGLADDLVPRWLSVAWGTIHVGALPPCFRGKT
jgi:hypothetical protein